jgi:hypothetical protein
MADMISIPDGTPVQSFINEYRYDDVWSGKRGADTVTRGGISLPVQELQP